MMRNIVFFMDIKGHEKTRQTKFCIFKWSLGFWEIFGILTSFIYNFILREIRNITINLNFCKKSQWFLNKRKVYGLIGLNVIIVIWKNIYLFVSKQIRHKIGLPNPSMGVMSLQENAWPRLLQTKHWWWDPPYILRSLCSLLTGAYIGGVTYWNFK